MIMDKKEYLKNRFKRDFLQYSLLQEDSLVYIYIIYIYDPELLK